MTDHIGLDVIAALDEGLLDRLMAERARSHLRTCPACAAREAALAEVPATLRRITAAEPPPMPAWVAARLDTALAAEAGHNGLTGAAAQAGAAEAGTAQAGAAQAGAADAGSRDAAPAAAADRVAPIEDAPSRRRRRPGRGNVPLRPVAAAAAVCVLAGGGYAVFRAAGSSGTGSPVAARHPSKAATTAPTRGGPLIEPGIRTPGPATHLPHVVRSGTNYQPGQLTAQAESVLSRVAGESHAPAGAGQPSATLPAGLQGCLQRIAYGQQAALVDQASYRGQAATIVVLPQPNGPGGQVWVAGPGCSSSRADVLAQAPISTIP